VKFSELNKGAKMSETEKIKDVMLQVQAHACLMCKKQMTPIHCEPCVIRGLTAAAIAELEQKPESEQGCKCQNCGKYYKVDFNIPKDLWLKISPKGTEAGLLCGHCIISKLENRGFNAFSLTVKPKADK
jgi:hypothetical protein